MHEFLLTVHVLAAVIWVGGGVAMHILGRRTLARGSGQEIYDFSKEINFVATRLYSSMSLVLLVAGLFLVGEAGYDFSQLWITLGLSAWLFSFVVGIGYYGRQGRKLQALVEERGTTDPGVAANLRQAMNVNSVELLILLLAVVDMTTKPGL